MTERLMHWLDTAPPEHVWPTVALVLAAVVALAHCIVWLDAWLADRRAERWAQLPPRKSEWR